MRERLKLFGYFALYWISFQILVRALFIIYNYAFTAQLDPMEILLVFAHGLKMDISISGYFLAATGLILTISVFTRARPIAIILNVMTILIIVFVALLVIVDIELYRHWGFRLNTTPLFYLGSEAFGSVDITVILKLLLIFILLVVMATYVYLKLIAPKVLNLLPADKKVFIPLLVISALMFIPIRGSLSVAPMNTGFVYFHRTKAFANHAAINVAWNFLSSLQRGRNTKYPEHFFDKDLAARYFSTLYPKSDTTVSLLSVKKPNVILFILESFTADVIEPLGGVPGVTPNLNALCKEGVLFTNFLSSGDRTDKGIISILSGYPSQPLTSIIKYPAKAQNLPFLNHYMQALGYRTSFTYGGDVDWANFRSYLTNSRFDHITSEDDFPDDVQYSKWGVHDHLLLEKAFSECDTATSPFFKVILTLSSHEPFDVPMTTPFLKGKDEASLLMNACHYTDSSIGVFIKKAKQTTWWDSTLVIFIADHGHRSPRGRKIEEQERFRIPMLFAGGAVAKDTVIHTYGGQTDLANTLLAQLNKSAEAFTFSKDMMAPNARSFAVYFFNDGFGFVTPDKYVVYDNPGHQFLRETGATADDKQMAKAYQQILYSDYNKK